MLVGNRLILRALADKDLEICRTWVNKQEICKGLLRHLPVADFEHRAWFKTLKKDKNQIYFAIELRKNKKYIGNIGLRGINWKDRNGDLFIYIGIQKMWCKGYGSEAVELFVDFCFKVLNLHKVYLRAVAYNKNAIRAYENVGFKKEGEFKDEVYMDGKYHNVMRMAVINTGI